MDGGEPMPERKPMDVHVVYPDFAGGIRPVVSAEIPKPGGRLTQFEVEMPSGVINAIDEAAARDTGAAPAFSYARCFSISFISKTPKASKSSLQLADDVPSVYHVPLEAN